MSEETNREKLRQIEEETGKTRERLKQIGLRPYGEWADGGDGWHDERWRENRLQYQICEAHLRTLKQEKLRLTILLARKAPSTNIN